MMNPSDVSVINVPSVRVAFAGPRPPSAPKTEMMCTIAPTNQAQNDAEARRGNAIEGEPTWSGTIAVAMPIKSGNATRKIAPVR